MVHPKNTDRKIRDQFSLKLSFIRQIKAIREGLEIFNRPLEEIEILYLNDDLI